MMQTVRNSLVILAAYGGAACGSGVETVKFYGILVDVPGGTSSSSSGSHLPMNYEGAPTEVTPGITFIHPDTHDFYLEIQKLPSAISLDGMKQTMGQQAQASKIAGRATQAGWDVEYAWKNEGAPAATVYVRYLQLDGAQYQCQYDDGNSKKLDVAEKICRSIRPNRAR